MAQFNVDVLVIGSGPAGNTAAIYLARGGLKISIISGMSIGGQLTTTTEVENFPGFPKPILGVDLMNNMLEQSKNLGVEIIYDRVLSVDFSKRPFICNLDGGDVYFAKFVIIATGASAKWLDIPSEEKFKGRGVSACATCDGSFYKGKVVAVIGGGSSAGTEALHLSHLCEKVYLIHRRDAFRMADGILDRVKSSKNIEFVVNTTIDEILGTESPKAVSGVIVKNLKTGEKSTISLNGVFVAIGSQPATTVFENSGLKFDENGYILTAPDSTRTDIAFVYAAGDVTDKPFKQAVAAAGYGCIAALEIQEDLGK
ncbi:MAG: thioredoxin-disulfide reductase [Rickettsiales bacterium]|nr:thioredoxin-disulfide reductase [Rickettsiales bacterium]